MDGRRMSGALTIHEIGGAELEPWLEALGGLRIRVFREFPYLYDGSLEYEREYLGVYQRCERSRIVLVTAAGARVQQLLLARVSVRWRR